MQREKRIYNESWRHVLMQPAEAESFDLKVSSFGFTVPWNRLLRSTDNLKYGIFASMDWTRQFSVCCPFN